MVRTRGSWRWSRTPGRRRAPSINLWKARDCRIPNTVSGRRDDVRKIKSGRDTGRGALAPHGYTDHRGPHEMEVLRRFASRIAVQAATLAAKGKTSSMILVANPHMLGLLRAEFEQVAKKGVKVQELARDYTWCTAPQLYQHLVSNGLLPHG